MFSSAHSITPSSLFFKLDFIKSSVLFSSAEELESIKYLVCYLKGRASLAAMPTSIELVSKADSMQNLSKWTKKCAISCVPTCTTECF